MIINPFFILTAIAAAAAVLTNTDEHCSAGVNVNIFKSPLPIFSLFQQNPYLSFSEYETFLSQKSEFPMSVQAPPPKNAYIWEYTGYFKAPEDGHFFFTLSEDIPAIIQFGFDENINALSNKQLLVGMDVKEIISQSPHNVNDEVNFALEKDLLYPIRILFASQHGRLSVFSANVNGIAQKINSDIRQVMSEKYFETQHSLNADYVSNHSAPNPEFIASGFYFKCFSASENQVTLESLQHVSEFRKLHQGSLALEYSNVQTELTTVDQAIIVTGHIQPTLSGTHIFGMKGGVIANLQVGPAVQTNQFQYNISDEWKIMDSRLMSLPMFSIDLKAGELYPFRIVILVDEKDLNWNIVQLNPLNNEEDVLGIVKKQISLGDHELLKAYYPAAKPEKTSHSQRKCDSILKDFINSEINLLEKNHIAKLMKCSEDVTTCGLVEAIPVKEIEHNLLVASFSVWLNDYFNLPNGLQSEPHKSKYRTLMLDLDELLGIGSNTPNLHRKLKENPTAGPEEGLDVSTASRFIEKEPSSFEQFLAKLNGIDSDDNNSLWKSIYSESEEIDDAFAFLDDYKTFSGEDSEDHDNVEKLIPLAISSARGNKSNTHHEAADVNQINDLLAYMADFETPFLETPKETEDCKGCKNFEGDIFKEINDVFAQMDSWETAEIEERVDHKNSSTSSSKSGKSFESDMEEIKNILAQMDHFINEDIEEDKDPNNSPASRTKNGQSFGDDASWKVSDVLAQKKNYMSSFSQTSAGDELDKESDDRSIYLDSKKADSVVESAEHKIHNAILNIEALLYDENEALNPDVPSDSENEDSYYHSFNEDGGVDSEIEFSEDLQNEEPTWWWDGYHLQNDPYFMHESTLSKSPYKQSKIKAFRKHRNLGPEFKDKGGKSLFSISESGEPSINEHRINEVSEDVKSNLTRHSEHSNTKGEDIRITTTSTSHDQSVHKDNEIDIDAKPKTEYFLSRFRKQNSVLKETKTGESKEENETNSTEIRSSEHANAERTGIVDDDKMNMFSRHRELQAKDPAVDAPSNHDNEDVAGEKADVPMKIVHHESKQAFVDYTKNETVYDYPYDLSDQLKIIPGHNPANFVKKTKWNFNKTPIQYMIDSSTEDEDDFMTLFSRLKELYEHELQVSQPGFSDHIYEEVIVDSDDDLYASSSLEQDPVEISDTHEFNDDVESLFNQISQITSLAANKSNTSVAEENTHRRKQNFEILSSKEHNYHHQIEIEDSDDYINDMEDIFSRFKALQRQELDQADPSDHIYEEVIVDSDDDLYASSSLEQDPVEISDTHEFNDDVESLFNQISQISSLAANKSNTSAAEENTHRRKQNSEILSSKEHNYHHQIEIEDSDDFINDMKDVFTRLGALRRHVFGLPDFSDHADKEILVKSNETLFNVASSDMTQVIDGTNTKQELYDYANYLFNQISTLAVSKSATSAVNEVEEFMREHPDGTSYDYWNIVEKENDDDDIKTILAQLKKTWNGSSMATVSFDPKHEELTDESPSTSTNTTKTDEEQKGSGRTGFDDVAGNDKDLFAKLTSLTGHKFVTSSDGKAETSVENHSQEFFNKTLTFSETIIVEGSEDGSQNASYFPEFSSFSKETPTEQSAFIDKLLRNAKGVAIDSDDELKTLHSHLLENEHLSWGNEGKDSKFSFHAKTKFGDLTLPLRNTFGFQNIPSETIQKDQEGSLSKSYLDHELYQKEKLVSELIAYFEQKILQQQADSRNRAYKHNAYGEGTLSAGHQNSVFPVKNKIFQDKSYNKNSHASPQETSGRIEHAQEHSSISPNLIPTSLNLEAFETKAGESVAAKQLSNQIDKGTGASTENKSTVALNDLSSDISINDSASRSASNQRNPEPKAETVDTLKTVFTPASVYIPDDGRATEPAKQNLEFTPASVYEPTLNEESFGTSKKEFSQAPVYTPTMDKLWHEYANKGLRFTPASIYLKTEDNHRIDAAKSGFVHASVYYPDGKRQNSGNLRRRALIDEKTLGLVEHIPGTSKTRIRPASAECSTLQNQIPGPESHYGEKHMSAQVRRETISDDHVKNQTLHPGESLGMNLNPSEHNANIEQNETDVEDFMFRARILAVEVDTDPSYGENFGVNGQSGSNADSGVNQSSHSGNAGGNGESASGSSGQAGASGNANSSSGSSGPAGTSGSVGGNDQASTSSEISQPQFGDSSGSNGEAALTTALSGGSQTSFGYPFVLSILLVVLI